MQDSMLANVLATYLDNVKEREFDLPLATLLRATGFYDIHLTHGKVEFGKDFIAKRDEGGITFQYSFQAKAGNISLTDWRNNIQGQMLDSLLLGLSHPNYDKAAPHIALLVCTGKLADNARLSLQDLNEKIKNTYHELPFKLWERENLIQMLETYGLGGVYQATAAGFLSYGKFYQLYGKSLERHISGREIEEHSRKWLDESIPKEKRLLCSAIESSIFAEKCNEKGFLYEASFSYLTLIRTIMFQVHQASNGDEAEQLSELYYQAVSSLRKVLQEYLADFQNLWDKSENNLASVVPSTNSFMAYPIHCARIMEMVGCLYFLETESIKRDSTIAFLASFISQEPGCAHIPSDYYAVSLVLPILVLCQSGYRDMAEELLHCCAVWLCDRYQEGLGLADISAEPYDEMATLCGYAFEAIQVRSRKSSLIASVICDLAAFVSNVKLYSEIVNDIKATGIIPQYWQVPDTTSLFSVEGEDIISYPHVDYADSHSQFTSFSFAEHIKHEATSFKITTQTGQFSLMLMMLLLRDRYFPTIWPSLSK